MDTQIRQRIIDITLDETLTGWDLVTALENEIAKIVPIDPSKDSDLEACGLKDESLEITFKSKGGTMPMIIADIESIMTKRLLAIAMFQQLYEKGALGTGRPDMDQLKELLESDDPDFERLGKLMDSLLGGSTSQSEVHMGFRNADKKNVKDYASLCREEDTSDCWKCKHRKQCSKGQN